MPRKSKVSPFYEGTTRQWKAQKRREWRELIRAYETFRLGCAYTPVYPTLVNRLEADLKFGSHALSVKEWGR